MKHRQVDPEIALDYIECPQTNFEKVREFMAACGQDIPEKATAYIEEDVRRLRENLITDEVRELLDTQADDITNTARELADILYVVYGTAVAYGIDLDEVFELVHSTNMKKISGPVREDGKELKPPGFEFPRWTLATMIARQQGYDFYATPQETRNNAHSDG